LVVSPQRLVAQSPLVSIKVKVDRPTEWN
jgi:hypothetical protein